MSERLTQDQPPPPELRGRVLGSLRAAGVLRPAPWRGWHRAARAAAVVAVFVAGYAARSIVGGGSSPPAPHRYALLLYSDSTFRPEGSTAERVAEYTAWAGSLRARNRLELGERLGDSAHVVSPRGEDALIAGGEAPFGAVAGLFIINAADMAEAVALAATCPHIRYGGRIVVRPIAVSTT